MPQKLKSEGSTSGSGKMERTPSDPGPHGARIGSAGQWRGRPLSVLGTGVTAESSSAAARRAQREGDGGSSSPRTEVALEHALSQAMDNGVPSLISRPPTAHLAESSGSAPNSPTRSRPTSLDLSRARERVPLHLPSPLSPSSDARRSPRTESIDGGNGGRPTLLQHLSSRSVLPTPILNRNVATTGADVQHGLVTRPLQTWAPDELSPSAKRHTRNFSSVSRGTLSLGDGQYSPASVAADDVDDGLLDDAGYIGTRDAKDESERDGLRRTTSPFQGAIGRLRSLMGLKEGDDPHEWLRAHREEIDRYLDERDTSGKGGTIEEDLIRIKEHYTSPKMPIVFAHGELL